MKTRAEIDAELARLEQLLPNLVSDCDPDEVLEAFAAEADALIEHVPAEQASYVSGKIDCLLASAGLIPGENEGESCLPS